MLVDPESLLEALCDAEAVMLVDPELLLEALGEVLAEPVKLGLVD
jgi:hypothetical protein